MSRSHIVVVSSLFPSAAAPFAGLFVRERMFRLAASRPLIVIAPQPWSPLDCLIRLFRPAFRPQARTAERMQGIAVYRPRFLSLPGLLKSCDSRSMALAIHRTLQGLPERIRPRLIDAHFLYPDGHAASLVARWHGLPLTVTVRGSKDRRLLGTRREPGMRAALAAAGKVIVVSDSLRNEVARPLGAREADTVLVGNGVDTVRFRPLDKAGARARLGIPADARVLITVGALARVKGFHRVIALLPDLLKRHPRLHYLIVGGASGHEDMSARLSAQVAALGLQDRVHFCGARAPDELARYYSAADLFVLASAYEGWANVLLEAMACGLPVIATRVGGNAQVVSDPRLGTLCEYWDGPAFRAAIDAGLARRWPVELLRAHACVHDWSRKIDDLRSVLDAACREPEMRGCPAKAIAVE